MKRRYYGLAALLTALCGYAYNPNASNVHRVGNYIYEVQLSEEDEETGYATLIDVKPGYEPKGEITIPGSITVDGVRYVVNHIGYIYHTQTFYDVDRAFKDFPEITKVNIPSTITRIGNMEFLGCTGINEFHVNSANKNFMDDNGVLFYRWAEEYDWNLFRMPPARPKTKYTLPDGIRSIEACAFADQKTLHQLILNRQCSLSNELWAWGNKSIREIDTSLSGWYETRDGMVYYTWGNDYDLVSCPPGMIIDRYVVPEKCKRIQGGAFCNTNLKEIVLHNDVRPEGYAFIGSALTSLEGTAEMFSSSLRSLCLGCKSLTKINIKGTSENPVIIGDYAFSLCESLSEVIIDSDNVQIRTGAFYGCSSLKEFPFSKVTLMDGSDIHSYWSGHQFEKSGLTTLTVPPTLETIPADSFRECTDLKEVIINPDGATSTKIIGGSAFEGCTSLETINLNGIQAVGGSAFEGAPVKKIIVPARDEEQGTIIIKQSFDFLEDTRIYLDTPEVDWVSAYGSIYNTKGTFIVSFLDKKSSAVPNFWEHLYCPAGMADWYENGILPYPTWGGEVSELFSLDRSETESTVTIIPNPLLESMTFEVTEVEIDGQKAVEADEGIWKADLDTPANSVGTNISYLVDGVPMSTLYPAFYVVSTKSINQAENGVSGIYTLSGRYAGKSSSHLDSGIYIIKYEDGTTCKIIIEK